MAKMSCVRATLSTGKKVILRQMKISDTEMAAQSVAVKANGDMTILQIMMQRAIVQLLLQAINEKVVTPQEKEDLDSLFTLKEYSEVMQVVNKISGGADPLGKEPEIEIIPETA